MINFINRDNFIPISYREMTYGPKGCYTDIVTDGTVEVTLRGKTQRVAATMTEARITARGLTGRYVQGGKAWPACVQSEPGKSDYVWFGRDDRSGRFNKANGLFFA